MKESESINKCDARGGGANLMCELLSEWADDGEKKGRRESGGVILLQRLPLFYTQQDNCRNTGDK